MSIPFCRVALFCLPERASAQSCSIAPASGSLINLLPGPAISLRGDATGPALAARGSGRGRALHLKAPMFRFGTPVPQSRTPPRTGSAACCVGRLCWFFGGIGSRRTRASQQLPGRAHHNGPRERFGRARSGDGAPDVRSVATAAARRQLGRHRVRYVGPFTPMTCRGITARVALESVHRASTLLNPLRVSAARRQLEVRGAYAANGPRSASE